MLKLNSLYEPIIWCWIFVICPALKFGIICGKTGVINYVPNIIWGRICVVKEEFIKSDTSGTNGDYLCCNMGL